MINKNSNGQNISADFINALTSDSRTYNVKILLNGTELDCSLFGLSVTKGSCGDENGFSVGSIVGSTLTLTTDPLPSSVKGKEMQVEVGVSVGSSYEYVTLGTFVVSDVQQTAYRTTITAYGATITRTGDAFVVPQTQTLANIATSISNSMSALAGHTISVTFDAGITTSKIVSASMNDLTVYQALGVLAGVCGGFAMDTYDGNVKICRFSDTPTLLRDTTTMLKLPVVAEENFEIAGVLCVVSPESEDEEGAVIPAVQFPATPTGQENLILQNKYVTSDLYTSYLATLAGYEYRPATVGLSYGDPRLEGDDVVQVTDINGNTYAVPCHILTHKYDGGFSTEVIAVSATPQENDVATSAGSLTEQLSNIGASAISARASAESAKASADSAQQSATTAYNLASQVQGLAQQAQQDASSAQQSATQASQSASEALTQAQSATASATSALKGLSTVEDVVDTLNWIATHCKYEKTTDTTIVTGKAYYTVTATAVSSPTDDDIVTYYELDNGAYVKTEDTAVVSGKTYYTVVGEPVLEPSASALSTYYELEITDAVSNYINTHVAVTDEGLWLIPDSGGNKVLIATGSGSTYTTAGTYIIGQVNGADTVLAKFLANGAQIGKDSTAHSVIDADGQRFYASNGTTQLANIGYGEGQAQSGTAVAPYYTFGVREDNEAIGNYSVAEGYDVVASGYGSHAEGGYTASIGQFAHAEGDSVSAQGVASHAQGVNTRATKRAQMVIGTYNVEDTSSTTIHKSGLSSYGIYAFIIGNGYSSESSNALTVDWNGNVEASGGVNMRGTLATGTNLNNVTTQGTYYLNGNNTYTNAPTTFGILEIIAYDSDASILMQRVTQNSLQWTRRRTASNTWTTWQLTNTYGIIAEDVLLADNVTVNASSYANSSLSVAKTGYTPIGVVGFHLQNASSSGANNTLCAEHSCYISGSSCYWIVRNTGGSNAKIKVTATILYTIA